MISESVVSNENLTEEIENAVSEEISSENVSEAVAEASAFDTSNAESMELSADSVSSGDVGASSAAVIVQEIDTTAIEQFLMSIDDRLEVMETYVSSNDVSFIGSDITDYNTTNGLLLCILVSVILAVLFNNTRRW